ncbi:MAG: RHS repeat-associated core domain-containing protein, partial [Lysobacteraceae bacterium]
CAPGVATTYIENQEADAFGNTVREMRGGSTAMQTFRQYDPLTGRLNQICAGSSATNCEIMRDSYAWDAVGNLSLRGRKDYGEDFWYDSVDRLDIARVNRVGATNYGYGTGQVTDWQRYDKLGNVCAHLMRGTDTTWLNYNGRAGCGLNVESGTVNGDMIGSPHQVRQDNAYSNFIYDSHGNQTFADSATSDSLDRTIRYNAQDQAYEIFKGTATAPNRMARFWYDPSGNRYKREDNGLGIVGTRRTIYIGNIEIVSENGTTTYKRYIGGALVQNVVNGIAANRYLFTDHIGSVVAATNETGAVLEGGGFNAFGERRTNGSATGITTTGLASTTRGFTGHEMVDGLDVIHMNGRIYDPTLGRFLQADPVIQAPGNPQNWNAYTYVFNNPYRYTDPTGMIGQEERQWLGAVVAIAASVFAPQIGYALYGTTLAANAVTVGIIAASGAVSGGITGGSQGALMGAFTSVLGLAGGGNAFVSAFAGGVSSALQGGNFGSGFLSAGVTALAVPGINANVGSRVGRVIARALLGGTVSSLTGGKFASGAAMAAMQGALDNLAINKSFRGKARPKQKLASTGAPTEEIARWMLSPSPEEKLKAAYAAIKYFKIVGEQYDIVYSPEIDDYGTMNPFGTLELGPASFYSWSDLGVTLGHEIEVHWERQFKIFGAMNPENWLQEYNMREVEADRYEISNAQRFGLSSAQIKNSEKQLNKHYGELNRKNRGFVDKGIYDPPY